MIVPASEEKTQSESFSFLVLVVFSKSSFKLSYNRKRLVGKTLRRSGSTRLQVVLPQNLSFSQTSTHLSIKQLDYELEISIA